MTHQHPVLLADPHRDLIPHCYEVQVTRSKCTNCGHEGESCETFAKTNIRAQHGGKYITNWRPLDAPKYNLPINIIHKPQKAVPFCSRCQDPTRVLNALPYPPVETRNHVGAAFVATSRPIKTPSHKKPVATTDDLMEGLDI